MRNIILVVTVSTILAGCASGPQTQTAKNEPQLGQVAASYSDKVGTVPADKLAVGNCPADNKWETLAWQKVMTLANACVKAKDYYKVEKMGDYMARTAHLTPWGPYYLALAAESRKDYPRAVWMLELALKKAPKEGLFHYELGRIHWENKADKEAIRHLTQASEMNPTLTGAHWVLGQLALQKNDYSEASKQLEKALVADSSHGPSLLAMSQLKIQQKDWDRAEHYLQQAISAYPRNAQTRMALAQVQEMHLKKFDQALQTYKQIKQLSAERKLDGTVTVNVDEKIQALQKNLAQASAPAKEAPRLPAAQPAKGAVKQ